MSCCQKSPSTAPGGRNVKGRWGLSEVKVSLEQLSYIIPSKTRMHVQSHALLPLSFFTSFGFLILAFFPPIVWSNLSRVCVQECVFSGSCFSQQKKKPLEKQKPIKYTKQENSFQVLSKLVQSYKMEHSACDPIPYLNHWNSTFSLNRYFNKPYFSYSQFAINGLNLQI